MEQSDGEQDKTKRADLIHQLDKQLRQDYVNIPLYAFPSMLSYRTDMLEGPLDKYINNPESNFFNLWAWEKK